MKKKKSVIKPKKILLNCREPRLLKTFSLIYNYKYISDHYTICFSFLCLEATFSTNENFDANDYDPDAKKALKIHIDCD